MTFKEDITIPEDATKILGQQNISGNSDQSPDIQNSTNELISPVAFSPASGKADKRSIPIRPASLAIGAVLLICALIVWFLFSAKSVYIATTPATKVIELNGGMVIKLADHHLMLEGDYTIRASAEGYFPLEQELVVAETQNQNFQFTLKKLPGLLTVNSPPGIEAKIWIDGLLAGESNHKIEDIAAGQHQVRVSAERYRDHEQSLMIEGKNTHQQLDITLIPAWATLSFETTPVGAQLSVDGQPLGSTPLSVEILEGERQLMLKLTGYKAWQELFDITAGENLTLPSINLQKADGLVMLASTPSGASITLNGTYRGQTPLELTLPPGQNYQFTLFKDGFSPAHKKLNVSSSDEQQVSIRLEAQLGDIDIKSSQADALLYIDGRLMGRANQRLTLPARQHRVTVKKTGYVDYSTVVLPRPNFAQVVNIPLKTVAQAKWENIKPLITSAAGQQLKLFKVNDTFTMGASRRQQGRRSNETLQKVSLTRAFYLGTKEVTNVEFIRFSKFHSSGHVKGNSLNGEDYPAVNVTWQQAALYCNWLSEQEKLPLFYLLEDGIVTGFNPQSNGYRLPTEAEWSWVARHQKTGSLLKYPWGPKLPPAAKSGNYADASAAALLGHIQVNYNDGHAVSAPVGSFVPNHKGLYDIGGNVAEWINDFYGVKTGLSLKTTVDPMGPDKGDHHVIRGSSWTHGTVTDLRLSFRNYGAEAKNDVGFRVARFVE